MKADLTDQLVTWSTPMIRAERAVKAADELLSFNKFQEALIEIEKAKRELTAATTFILTHHCWPKPQGERHVEHHPDDR